MRLVELNLRALPGFRAGLHLREADLDGRVRVLHGPNGIGKSSIVRALRAVLWPELSGEEPVDVEAAFEVGGARWTVVRRGGRTRWTRDGADSPPPSLPEARHARNLLVELSDLAADGDESFVEQLGRELSGGYDLAGVAAGFPVRPQPAKGEASLLRAARQSVVAARREQRELLQREAGRPALLAEREAARNARGLMAGLQAALELVAARAALRAAEAARHAFPAGTESLQGDEPRVVAELREEQVLAEAQARVEQARLGELTAAIAQSGLAQPVPVAALDEIDAAIIELRGAEEAMRGAAHALDEARARLASVRSSLGQGVDAEAVRRVDAARLAEAEDFVVRAQAATAKRQALQAQLSALGETGQEEPPDAEALVALQRWLSTPEAEPRPGWEQPMLVAAAVLLLLGAAAAGVLWHPLGAVAVLPAAALSWIAWSASRATRRPAIDRAAWRAQYAETREDPPEAWTPEGVSTRLAQLSARDVAARRAAARRAERDPLLAQLKELDRQQQLLDAQREPLRALVGAAADAPDTLLAQLARSGEALRRSHEQEAGCRANFETAETRRAALQARVSGLLSVHGVTDAPDAAGADRRARALRERSGRLGADQAAATTAEAAFEREQGRALLAGVKLAELWDRLRLAPGDDAELQRRIDRLPDHREACRRVEAARQDVGRIAAAVPGDLAGLDEAELRRRHDGARTLAEREVPVERDLAELDGELRRAHARTGLEEALARQAAGEVALAAAFVEHRRNDLARCLLDDVRSAHEVGSRPRVLVAAQELFARFTRGRYRLVAPPGADGRPVLRAIDSHDAVAPLDLAQLSDGTRAQLLLAARLSFLAEVEGGEPLPFVLDDALATSDPARLAAIGASLLEEARVRGRQVFVLTTDAADLGVLRPEGTQDGDVAGTDLAALRRDQAPVAGKPRLLVGDPEEVPSPAGRSPQDWAAALCVPPVDPRRPVEELHLWYVLHHDPSFLFRLLQAGIERVGSLETLADFGWPGAPEREMARVRPWIGLAAEVLESWRIGRGKPLDRAALEAAGVTVTFIDRMVELAEELGGDAKSWLAVVEAKQDERAKRYREETLAQNRESLLALGYLDERPVLDAEGAWIRVLSALPDGPQRPPESALRARFELLWSACGA